MDKDHIIKNISEEVVSELAGMPDYFLIEVKVNPKNDVKVFIDADMGSSIDKLAGINRVLYKKIEEESWFGQGANFSLEVSSPGLDEPLKLIRQYRKNIGRPVEGLRNDGIKFEGVLRQVSGDGITLEQAAGIKKNKQIKEVQIPFNQIKYTKVSVVF